MRVSLPLHTSSSSSSSVVEGVLSLLTSLFGEPTAADSEEEIAALRRAREQTTSVKLDTETDAEAAVGALVVYHMLLERLVPPLEPEVYEDRRTLISWNHSWGEPTPTQAEPTSTAPTWLPGKKKEAPSSGGGATTGSLRLERVAVLTNLASALSARASLLSTGEASGADSIKTAAKHFSYAAGALEAAEALAAVSSGQEHGGEFRPAALKAAKALLVAHAQVHLNALPPPTLRDHYPSIALSP